MPEKQICRDCRYSANAVREELVPNQEDPGFLKKVNVAFLACNLELPPSVQRYLWALADLGYDKSAPRFDAEVKPKETCSFWTPKG